MIVLVRALTAVVTYAPNRARRAVSIADLLIALVVLLGACDAGSGALRLGDAGATDFSSPWLLLGSDCVVLPPGKISLNGSLQYGEAWHQYVNAGWSPAEAARLTRLDLRDGEHPHPAHAHWYVTGLGAMPIFEAEHAAHSNRLESSRIEEHSRIHAWRYVALAVGALLFFGWIRRRACGRPTEQ